MGRRGIIRALVAIVFVLTLAFASSAFAFDETTTTIFAPGPTCQECHMAPGSFGGTGNRYGPHGNYSTTTSRCEACHTVHDAPEGGDQLLPGATVMATCYTCHDGTAAFGEGVYGAIEARMGPGNVKSDHSVDTTNSVPGGDAATGGSMTMSFRGENDYLTCSDCHSPHGTNCVTPFLGERQRSWQFYRDYHGLMTVQAQNRLLKQKPGPATTPVADYGSDWCAACHAGRPSGAMVNNHPVETDASQAGQLYVYRAAGIVALGPYPTLETTIGPMGVNTRLAGNYNRAYLWPFPRVGAQIGHYPICQQCHEDARDVGSLDAAGTGATPSAVVVTEPDGRVATDNPRFQNFPHESTNLYLLVETADNLCLNCHPPAGLP